VAVSFRCGSGPPAGEGVKRRQRAALTLVWVVADLVPGWQPFWETGTHREVWSRRCYVGSVLWWVDASKLHGIDRIGILSSIAGPS
jgi:hypothetical protein